MRVLLTGSSGFIGTNLVSSLGAQGCTVAGVDLRVPQEDVGLSSFSQIDIRDGAKMAAAVSRAKPEVLIHLAARTDLVESRDLSAYTSNTVGVQSVVDSCQQIGVRRALLASSRLVFSPQVDPAHRFDYSPNTDYGRSKVAGESIVRRAKELGHPTELILARPTSIWGPRFSLPYAQFFQAVLSGRYVHPRAMRIRKSFGYVENVCQQIGLLARAEFEQDNGPIWLTDICPIEIKDFADCIRRAAGKEEVPEVPLKVMKLGAVLGDVLKGVGLEARYPLTSDRLRNMTVNTVYDTTLERTVYASLQPSSTIEGIRKTLEWLHARQG